jgi:hypothetical protein
MSTADLSANWQRSVAALSLAVISGVTAGCGFSLNEAAIGKMSAIQATGNKLRVTQTMQFKTEAPVIWSVNGVPGGNAGHRSTAQQSSNDWKLSGNLPFI